MTTIESMERACRKYGASFDADFIAEGECHINVYATRLNGKTDVLYTGDGTTLEEAMVDALEDMGELNG